MEIRLEGKTAHIECNESLDALGVERLIHQLAVMRATMDPAVPMSLALADLDRQTILEEDRPSATIALRRDGTFRLKTRNRGIGWLAAVIDQHTARTMAEFILTRLPPGPAVSLISDDDGKRH